MSKEGVEEGTTTFNVQDGETMNLVAFATLGPQFRTDGAGLTNLMRNIGSAVGVSLTTTVLASSVQTIHSQLAHYASPFNRALGVGSEKPSELAPGIPTIASAGVPGYVCETLHAMFAPAGTPAAAISRLHQAIDRFLQSLEGKNQFIKGGVEAAPSTPDQLAKIMKSEMATIGKVLQAAGVKPQ